MKQLISLFILFSFFSNAYGQSKIDYPIYFAYKIAKMDTTEEKRLGFFLKNFDSFTIDSIAIKGYCDDRGKKKINDTLSKKRAETILNLIKARIKYPFPSNLSGEGSISLEGNAELDNQRKLNRRGELELFYSLTKRKTDSNKSAKKTSTSILPKVPIIDSAPDVKSFLESAKVGQTVDLKIYFEGSSSVIKKSSAEELINLLNFLKENKSRKIKITGHIYDEKGPTEKDAFDQSTKDRYLSTNRAKKVYTFLINNGIESERLSYEGMAAKFPRNKYPEDDRRVEIEVVE